MDNAISTKLLELIQNQKVENAYKIAKRRHYFSSLEINAAIERNRQKAFYTDEQLIKKLGRKYRINIKNLGKIAKSIKFLVSTEDTVFPLACTSASSIRKFNTVKNAAAVIRLASNLGLIECIKRENRPEFIYGKGGFCRSYIADVDRANQILRIAESLSLEISKDIIVNSQNNTESIPVDEISESIFDKIDITSKCRLPLNLTDEQINFYILKKYPQITTCQTIADELNKSLPEAEQIKFSVKVKRTTKFITKIKIRATCPIVSLKEHETENEDYKGKWRKEYLKERFGEYEEYDVHSSISNVASLLKTGIWTGQDFYPILGLANEWENFPRQSYKEMFMTLFFSKSNDAALFSLCKSYYNQAKETETKQFFDSLYDNIRKVFNEQDCNSRIFMHESCIYLKVRKALSDKKIDCVQIYDGFYFKKGTMPLNMDSIIKECAEEYFSEFIENMQK